MFEVGRVCVKLAGRDADKKCVVVKVVDAHTVLIDGETRRRNCNVRHLLPLEETLELKEGADHAAVVAAFEKLGIALPSSQPRKTGPRPRAVRKKKEAPAPKQAAKPEEKPANPAGEPAQ